MELRLSDEERQILQTAGEICAKHRRKGSAPGDDDLPVLAALDENGYLDVFRDGGPSAAALVIEAAGSAAVAAPIAGRVLVAPALGLDELPPAIALAPSLTSVLVRYAQGAEAFLAIDGDEAVLAMASGCTVEPVASRYGPSLGRVTVNEVATRLGPGSAKKLRAAWWVAIATEASGAMVAAIAHTSRYVTERKQFGKPIGAFQAVQHELAEAYIFAQGSLWLSRRAATALDSVYLTASAAAFACKAANKTYTFTHQVSGAIGLTIEHGLVDWTMPLIGWQSELGGLRAHARDVAVARLVNSSAL
jgi:alkylation response protein AidB-like acyl-CoA dehydrogenase